MADMHLQHCKVTASGLADPLQEGVPESVFQLLGLKLLSPLGRYVPENWSRSISQTSDSKRKGAISGI